MFWLRALSFSMFFSFLLPSLALSKTDEEVLAGAQERIEKYRKADAQLILKDSAGKPLPEGAKLSIEQTKHAFLFGGNTRWLFDVHSGADEFQKHSALAQKYSDQFTAIFNYCTVPIFWGSYEREEGKPQYALTQANIDWAKKYGIKVKAHPLVWNWVAEPKWLEGRTPEQAKQAQIKRVQDFMDHFKGQITVYDVVNEPSGWDRKPGWKNSPLLVKAANEMGIQNWQRLMYETARKADPTATLMVNDFTLEGLYEKDGIDPLINKDGSTLFDGIGFQSHMFGGTWPLEKTWEICERFSKYNKPIHFTEVSIVSGDRQKVSKAAASQDVTGERTEAQWKVTPETEQRQANDVVKFYTTLFSHPSVQAINWWYVTDLNAHPAGSPPGLLRADMSPKPAYLALKKLIKETWWTKTNATVNQAGEASMRGFYGEYNVSYESPDGRTLQGKFTLSKDSTAPMIVNLQQESK